MANSDLDGLGRPPGPQLIRASAVAKRLDVSPVTLKKWSERGILPPPVRLGPRQDRYYRLADIANHLEHSGSSQR